MKVAQIAVLEPRGRRILDCVYPRQLPMDHDYPASPREYLSNQTVARLPRPQPVLLARPERPGRLDAPDRIPFTYVLPIASCQVVP
jgi:hypothetical protein